MQKPLVTIWQAFPQFFTVIGEFRHIRNFSVVILHQSRSESLLSPLSSNTTATLHKFSVQQLIYPLLDCTKINSPTTTQIRQYCASIYIHSKVILINIISKIIQMIILPSFKHAGYIHKSPQFCTWPSGFIYKHLRVCAGIYFCHSKWHTNIDTPLHPSPA